MAFRRVEYPDGASQSEHPGLPAEFKNGGIQIQNELSLDIQAQTALILCELIRLYTCSDSSSVKDETAAAILCSIRYALDAFAKSCSTREALYLSLQKNGVRAAYNAGREQIRVCFEQSKQLYEKLFKNRLTVPLDSYNDTLEHALPSFFSSYDMEFGAHETVCSMDYPLAFDDMSIEGIFYIHQYLNKLELETEFCKCFSLRSIIDFLRGYSVKFQFDVTQSPLNLFEILFDQAVFAVLSENSVGLSVSLPGFQSMCKRLSVLSSQEIRLEIRRAVEKIVSEFSLGNPRTVKYLSRSRLRLTRRFLSAFNGDNLQLMAVIDGENPNEGKILFEDGERMNDEDFSNLVELASQCSETPEKIQLARGIHSFWDFIDFLESDCLYGEEYIQIFESLGNEELAVLGSFLFEEELRIGPFQLTDRVIDQYHHLTQQDWQTHYLNYIRSLDPTKKSLMEDLINRMILPSNNARDFQ